MKPKLDQEIWHLGYSKDCRYLEKMRVGFLGTRGFICYEQLQMYPISYSCYGSTWFLEKEDAVKWLEENGYELKDDLYWDMKGCIYVKKGERNEIH